MTQHHDSQVSCQVLKRILHKLSTITADNKYDGGIAAGQTTGRTRESIDSTQRV